MIERTVPWTAAPRPFSGPAPAVIPRATARLGSHRSPTLGGISAIAILAVVVLMAIPSSSGARPQSGTATIPVVTVQVHEVVATETPYFWEVDVDGMTDAASSVAAHFLNSTPIKSLRYGDNWLDQSNWTNNCYYDGNSQCSGAQGEPVTFGTLCEWLKDRCTLGVPAETNSVSTTTALVHWLATQTSWTPTCWAIGNEPEGWTHFNIPWSEWSESDAVTPTPAQFALDAANMTNAIRHIYPHACIIGMKNNDNVRRTGPWTAAVVAADPNVSAVAITPTPITTAPGRS